MRSYCSYNNYLDLSTPGQPSWALICGQASGKQEWEIVKYKGMYTTKEAAARWGENEKPFQLMALPVELRHQILSHLCVSKTIPAFLKGVRGLPPTAVPLPAIARVGNRKLRAETILIAIKQSILEIHSGPGNEQLQRWLAPIDFTITDGTSLKTGFDAVHSLSFPYFSRFPHASLPIKAPNNDIELMLKCKNLRELTLQFANSELRNEDFLDMLDRSLIKSIYQLRRQYRLDSMLKIFNRGELRVVHLHGPHKGTSGYTALETMGEWMRWEFVVRANMHAQLTGSRDKSVKILDVVIN